MTSRTTSAVLFDLDGVLVDSRKPFAASVNHALGSVGNPRRTDRELARYLGPPLAATFAELVGEPVDSPVVADCVSRYRVHYAVVSLTDTRVNPGIREALDTLGDIYRLGVATSKPRALAEPLLRALGLRARFDVVAGPDLVALAEPKSHTIGVALDELAVAAPCAVMVGDRSHDIVGARAHEMPSIGVTWGIGDHGELVDAGADIVVDSPSDLTSAVAELANRK